MVLEFLFAFILLALGAIWLTSPLFVLWLLRRARRLEKQVEALQVSVQYLTLRSEAAAELADGATRGTIPVENGRGPLRNVADQPEREVLRLHNAAVGSGLSAGEHAVTVPPPPLPVQQRQLALDGHLERDNQDLVRPLQQEQSFAGHREAVDGPPSANGEDQTADEAVTSRLWEERIGGHWLNRIGGLLLVTGITLFLGYSLQQLGPRGRLALGAAVSLGLLSGGFAAERWQAYRGFSAGLMATGWAGLYMTAYAAHGIPAARVIENPFVAMGVLVAVSVGMVSHSLRYRTPLVTAIAYLFGFVAIAISPVGPWSAYGCVLLAGSVLVVATRFGWDGLAVVGLIGTYSTLLLRGREMLEAADLWHGFTAGHALVLICWLAFEGYDILTLAKGPTPGIGRAILPLNLCCMLAAAIGIWPNTVSPSLLSAAVAAAYGMSTLIRLAVRRPAAFDKGSTPLNRGMLGGYEATVTVAAIATAVTIWQRFPGQPGWQLSLLVLEAQLLFLLGFFFREPFLRLLAIPFFGLCFVPLQLIAADPGGGWSWLSPTPLPGVPQAVGMAGVFVVDRTLARFLNPQPQHSLDSLFSYAATGLLAACVVAEGFTGDLGLQPYHVGVIGLLAAWLLMQVAIAADLDELFTLALLGGAAGGLATFVMNGMLVGLPPGAVPQEAWKWLLPAAAVCGLCGWQLSRGPLPVRQLRLLSDCRALAVGAGIWLLVLFGWHLLPAAAVAVAWMLMAMLVLAAGERLADPTLRFHGHLLCLLVASRLFMANYTTFGMTAGISHRLLTVGPIAAAFAFFAWWSPKRTNIREASGTGEAFMALFAMHFATLSVAVLMRFELGRVLALPAWALLGVCLLVLEKRWPSTNLRLQAMVLAVVCFARSWSTHFFIPEGTLGPAGPVVIGTVVILCLFAGMFMSPRPSGLQARGTWSLNKTVGQGRVVYCAMATVLWALLLYHEVPWRAITAAWGLEGALLVVAGFALRERLLRLAGLAVLSLCIPKLFFYDLRNLDTPARIASFLLLGTLLIAASWAYTRFRSQVRGLLEDQP